MRTDKETYTIFDIVEQLNKDLGEDLLYIKENEYKTIEVFFGDRRLFSQSSRTTFSKNTIYSDKDEILTAKKNILRTISNISSANSYNCFLEYAKKNIIKIRNA